MLYAIDTNEANETVIRVDGTAVYLVTREQAGIVFELRACRFGEPRPTTIARNKVRDYLVDQAARNLRASGHIAQVPGGVLVWLLRSEVGVDVNELGYLTCANTGRVLSCQSLRTLDLQLNETRTATLSERMDAGDASFRPDEHVYFIPVRNPELYP